MDWVQREAQSYSENYPETSVNGVPSQGGGSAAASASDDNDLERAPPPVTPFKATSSADATESGVWMSPFSAFSRWFNGEQRV